MLTDARLTFADATASGANATAVIGNVIDLKATGVDGNVDDNVGGARDIGNGQPVYLTIVVTEDYVGTVATDDITISLISSDNVGLTSGVTHLTTANYIYGLGTDVLDAGDVLFQGVVPAEASNGVYGRYLGLVETVNGATTTGKISAFLSLDPNQYKYYTQADVNL